MWKRKRIVKAVLDESPPKKQFSTPNPLESQNKIFFEKICRVNFEILWCTTFMQKIKKILRAILGKNWSLSTNYLTKHGSDLMGPFPTKGQGSKSKNSLCLFCSTESQCLNYLRKFHPIEVTFTIWQESEFFCYSNSRLFEVDSYSPCSFE